MKQSLTVGRIFNPAECTFGQVARFLSLVATVFVGDLTAQEPKSPSPAKPHDVLFLASGRPVLFRFTIFVDGKSHEQAWRDFLEKYYTELDRNGDGKLDAEEKKTLAAVSKALGTLQLLEANSPSSSLLQKVLTPDVRNPADLAAYFERANFRPFRLQTAAPAMTPAQAQNAGFQMQSPNRVGDFLFQKLDTDGNGRLSVAEMDNASRSLRRIDFDQDESFAAAELNPAVRGPIRVATTPATSTVNPWFIQVSPETAGSNAQRVLTAYDRAGVADGMPADRRLSRTEVAVPEPQFAALDRDASGFLDHNELADWLKRPAPDVLVTIRSGDIADGEKPLEIRPGGDVSIDPKYASNSSPIFESLGKLVTGQSLVAGTNQARLVLGGVELQFSAFTFTKFAVFLENELARVFQAVDLDKNEYIDRNESRRLGLLSALFSEIDRDGDGKAFKKEFEKALMPVLSLAARQYHLSIADEGFDFFGKLDANGDSQLSPREIRRISQTVLEWDRNGDGQVGSDEFPQRFRLTFGHSNPLESVILPGPIPAAQRSAPFPVALKNPGAPEWFRRMDLNNDGDVSAREFLGTAATFAKLDRDEDGLIDANEAAAAWSSAK